ncbi:MAG: hypothetical protein PHP74_04070 [Candidatus Gracilibacteria bacterium]|nr:hypothetical protein [Candidatus Gracilibacteria bacterium]
METERQINQSDLLVTSTTQVLEKIQSLGLPDSALESIAMCECPISATQETIRSLVQQNPFMDSPDTAHQILINVGVLKNETPQNEYD